MGYHKGSGHSSIHMHVELDVPQETVLGPLANALSSMSSSIRLFADDYVSHLQ